MAVGHDAAAGYTSLSHILKLAPDIIKLTMSLSQDIDRDPAKRAFPHLCSSSPGTVMRPS